MLGRFAVTVLVMVLNIPVIAQDPGPATPSIVSQSPFLPPGFQPPGQPGSAAPVPASANAAKTAYEFRGVYQLGGTYYYHLYNVSEQKGNWITEEGTGDDGIEIIRFDAEKNAIAVNVGGERLDLNLIQTSDKPLPLSIRPAAPEKPEAQPERPNQGIRRRVIRPRTSSSANSTNEPVRRRVVNNPSNP